MTYDSINLVRNQKDIKEKKVHSSKELCLLDLEYQKQETWDEWTLNLGQMSLTPCRFLKMKNIPNKNW